MFTRSAFLFAALLTAPLFAQTATPATPAEEPQAQTETETEAARDIQPFGLTAPTMTDDWFGLGDQLNDVGINAMFILNQQYMSVFKGRQHETRGDSATYDLIVTLDMEKLGLWKNGDMLVHARQQWNANINPFTGANQQVVDDADGDHSIYIDQLWYRHYFLENKLNLKLGYLDYQTIVDRNKYANSEDKQFMNAALDNNPLIPTASATGLGMALTIDPCDWYSLVLGTLDAERLPLYKCGFSTVVSGPAWYLFYMEHNFKPTIETANGPLKGNYRIGLIYDPLPKTRFTGGQPVQQGNHTLFYLSFDQELCRENDTDNQGLGAFFRYSHVNDNVNRFDNFISGGLSYVGLIPTRDTDELGFAVASLLDSSVYKDNVNANSGSETIYELYYRIQITPWLAISPDVQYIDNAGANDSLSNAFVGGLRLRVVF